MFDAISDKRFLTFLKAELLEKHNTLELGKKEKDEDKDGIKEEENIKVKQFCGRMFNYEIFTKIFLLL